VISTEAGLFHRALPPRAGSEGIHPTIILLHGRGADEEDLAGLSPFLDPRLLVITVRAPFPFSYGGGYTWYEMGPDGTPDSLMFRESYDRLSSFVSTTLSSYPADPHQLFLFGFSMGSMMALSLALASPGLFRGVIANSGYVPENTGLALKWNDPGATSFFIAHGTDDPVVPVALGRRTRDQFAASNASWVYREYPMGHEISQESLLDIAEWMRGLMTQSPMKRKDR
jgi:phospholipase/carboxylesterase